LRINSIRNELVAGFGVAIRKKWMADLRNWGIEPASAFALLVIDGLARKPTDLRMARQDDARP
jgi:hypothetical protein